MAAIAVTLALTGCAPSSSTGSSAAGGNDAVGARTPLTVYAASSLAGPFARIVTAFEQQNPEYHVRTLVTDGSNILARQILAGAPVDVFAAADEQTMATVTAAGLANDAVIFATNTLVVATPADNPADIWALTDLARPQLLVVTCAVEVPCGQATQRLLDAAGVTVRTASQEQNVTAVLTKVATGEADAGIVYASDVTGMPTVSSFVPEHAAEVVNRYPIAVTDTSASASADGAAAFVAFVTGAEGQRILADAGLGASE